MRIRFMVLAGTVLVAVLALSGVAWAADSLVVTKTVPNGRATGVAPTANIDAYFNRDVEASTVTSTSRKFKIRKKGTTAWLGATRSVDNTISPTSTNGGSESVATLNPDADLAPNTIYQVVIVGGTSGVKGVSGELLSTSKRWTFTTAADTTPPDTFIDSGPTGTVTSDSASFSFSSSKSGSTFQCSLDGSPFSGCTSPKDYTGLINGSHTFQVRAIDATTGTTDPTPASRSWTVNKATGVTVTPTTLNLSVDGQHGDVLGCTRTENLTVTNNGPGDVTFADVSITGMGAKYFSDGAKKRILNNGPFTVLAGNYFVDQVTFTAGSTPTERNSDTVYSATLTYKDGTGATIGDPVTLTATARCLNFG